MENTNSEMSFEDTRLVARSLYQAIVMERGTEDAELYSRNENFQSMTQEQKQFFTECVRESMFEGIRHCLFLFDGKTTLPDGEPLEATITMKGEQCSFIAEHFSSMGEEEKAQKS